MISTKIRRHSGRYTPVIHQKQKISEMIENAEEPGEEYDDWDNYRDGFRYDSDKTHIRNERMNFADKDKIRKQNNKLVRKFLIRKAKKFKNLFFKI